MSILCDKCRDRVKSEKEQEDKSPKFRVICEECYFRNLKPIS